MILLSHKGTAVDRIASPPAFGFPSCAAGDKGKAACCITIAGRSLSQICCVDFNAVDVGLI